jgi:hypothetical protein
MIPPIAHQGKPLRLGLYPARAHKSLDQPQHSSPLHSIESVYDVVIVEYGEQPLHGLHCIARPGLDILPKDAPGVQWRAEASFGRGYSREERYFDCSETRLEAGLPVSTTRVTMNFTGLSLELMAA